MEITKELNVDLDCGSPLGARHLARNIIYTFLIGCKAYKSKTGKVEIDSTILSTNKTFFFASQQASGKLSDKKIKIQKSLFEFGLRACPGVYQIF